MKYRFRPLRWTGPVTEDRRGPFTFKASFTDTLSLLEDELWRLDATDFVIEADFTEADLRLDGMPRSGARQPVHPGVRVFFESRFGPLMYQTDSCVKWQHNVRSVALGLEALRAVDRYGVTKRGEQYDGFTAIAGPATPGPMTVGEATNIITEHAGLTFRLNRLDPDAVRFAYNKALRLTHPDNGGNATDFQRVQEAKRVLDGAP